MRLIALDCEYNQPSQKCIEIGATCFQSDNGKLIENFRTFVDPLESINKEITELTGIWPAEVLNQPAPNLESPIVAAANMLSDFKQRNQINAIPIVWGAGNSNDVKKIYDEAKIESPFSTRIIDVKAIYQMLANSCNNEMRQNVGLEKACKMTTIDWDYRYGNPHRALADAYNTYRIYVFLSKCLKGGFSIAQEIKDEK